MVDLKFDLVFFLLNIFYVSECARRIEDGVEVSTQKRYVVYLVKAPVSEKIYDSWMCGGAIVSTSFIITSAACVNDVEFMYAIAGYNKYVRDEDIEKDKCTSIMKKKVVYTCVPLKYDLQYDKTEKWSFIDIALVKVESPYDFNDAKYDERCSYRPTAIPINYEKRFQVPGTDGLVFGWGHAEKWRKPEDSGNYNQPTLRYASIKILDKNECKKDYETFPQMAQVIDKYMICTLEKGEFDENGIMVLANRPALLDGCKPGVRLSDDGQPCENDPTRRNVLRSIHISNNSNIAQNNRTKTRNVVKETINTRRSGICQNDHGGPLMTWVGSKEVLIGVASVFLVSSDSKCVGPYLYTSTQCNGIFIDCILSNSTKSGDKGRRLMCESPPIQRGYDTVEKYISWKNHPAGAADNEALARGKNLVNEFNSMSDEKKNVGVSKAIEELRELELAAGHEKIRIRPQRPLNK